MRRDHRPAPAAPEKRHPITVELTAREIAALSGVAFVCTSADDEHHRANYAEAAVKRVQEAARQQRP